MKELFPKDHVQHEDTMKIHSCLIKEKTQVVEFTSQLTLLQNNY